MSTLRTSHTIVDDNEEEYTIKLTGKSPGSIKQAAQQINVRLQSSHNACQADGASSYRSHYTLIAILTTELQQAKDSLNANQSQPCDWLRWKIGKLDEGIKTVKEMDDNKVVRASLEKRDWFMAVTRGKCMIVDAETRNQLRR